MDQHGVTGARVDVEIEVDAPPERIWDLVTDVSRIGQWSPECEHAEWLDGGGPRPGARFTGRNRFTHGFVSTVTCVVSDAARPRTFTWVVLDAAADPRRPGSTWTYDLAPGGAPGRTLVRHSFEHGPGDTGMREAVDAERDPRRARAARQARLAQIRRNITETIEAIARTAKEEL